MMQFKENAEVISSTGEKVGRIDRVVIDPKSEELTHIVVKKGFLFSHDKVVPIDLIDNTAEDQVVLKDGPQAPEDFPDFEETHYVQAPESDTHAKRDPGAIRSLAWYYPLPGGPWWRAGMGGYPGYPQPPYMRSTKLNIPEDTVPLEEGAKVLSSDDEHVGDVERIYVEEKEQRATHVVISQGLLSKTRKLIPTMWVERVLEDEVHLTISKNFIDNLPEYAEQE